MSRSCALGTLLSAWVVAAGCTLATDPLTSGELSIRVTPANLVLTNRGDAPLFATVVGESQLALYDPMPPCTVPQPSIDPGASRTVPRPRRGDGGREVRAMVSWWHCMPAPGGGLVPDGFRSLRVALP
jgi:hypothetical protein